MLISHSAQQPQRVSSTWQLQTVVPLLGIMSICGLYSHTEAIRLETAWERLFVSSAACTIKALMTGNRDCLNKKNTSACSLASWFCLHLEPGRRLLKQHRRQGRVCAGCGFIEQAKSFGQTANLTAQWCKGYLFGECNMLAAPKLLCLCLTPGNAWCDYLPSKTN